MLRKAWKFLSIGLLFLEMNFKYGEASSSQNLRNMAAVVGSKMNISCVSNPLGRVHWYHVKSQMDEAGSKINDGGSIILQDFSNFFGTGQIPGQTLETNSIRSENAGLLQCKVAGNEFDAQLTVLDTEPTCNVKIVSKGIPTRAEFYCSVGYSGFWSPTMEWIRNKGKTTIDGHLNITANKVTLTMQVITNNTDVYAEYQCRTFFSNETRPRSGASNIPDNDYLCIPTNNMEPTANGETSNGNGGYVIWIITGLAAAACIVVLAVIIIFLKRNPEVCRKSSEPDLVQLADIVPNANVNFNMENRVNDQREVVADEEPEQPGVVLYQNRVYAEVEVCDREYPPHMHDSPAWSGSAGTNNANRRKGTQHSPACSHPSRTGTPRMITSRSGTPRSESPIVGVETIEYLDINSVATIPTPQMQRPRRPPARLPTTNNFQPAMYASIDHTSRPPPPLPPGDD